MNIKINGSSRINFDRIKNYKVVSTREALSDVEPMKWSDKVLSGKSKALVYQKTREELCVKEEI